MRAAGNITAHNNSKPHTAKITHADSVITTQIAAELLPPITAELLHENSITNGPITAKLLLDDCIINDPIADQLLPADDGSDSVLPGIRQLRVSLIIE